MFERHQFSQYLLLAVLTIGIAIGLAVWQTQFRYGWLEMAFGQYSWLFWIAVAVWATSLTLAIKRFRSWWLLITALPVLYPVTGGAVLLTGPH